MNWEKDVLNRIAQSDVDYLDDFCYIYALNLAKKNRSFKIRGYVYYNAEDIKDWYPGHFWVVDPSSGKAFDSRGSFDSENELLSSWHSGYEENVDLESEGMESDIWDFTIDEIESLISKGFLKKA